MNTNNLLLFGLFYISIVTWNCAGNPFDPPRSDEIPAGPGVISKDDDGIVLYDSNEDGLFPASEGTDAQSSPDAVANEPARSAHKEFESYQQWLEWKKTAAGTSEYEGFQQWR